jgi:hypothetical protein
MPEQQNPIMERLNAFFQMSNIADDIEDDVLKEISERVYDEYVIDKTSRLDWEKTYEQFFELAEQIGGQKTYRGKKVSDKKYPNTAMHSTPSSAPAGHRF